MINILAGVAKEVGKSKKKRSKKTTSDDKTIEELKEEKRKLDKNLKTGNRVRMG